MKGHADIRDYFHIGRKTRHGAAATRSPPSRMPKKEADVIAIRIITDSTSDLSREDQARLDIQVIPLTVRFSGVSYLDGVELTNEQFYDKLDTCKELPTTSQVPPQTFIDIFQHHLDGGDEVVGIFISSEISGTYNSARIAKETLASDRLHLVDSRITTLGLAVLVAEAARCRDEGLPAAQIAEHIAELTKKVRLLVVINTLKYLRKGGRISAAATVLGEALGMKPIVTMVDGTVHPAGKARGMQAALKELLRKVTADLPDLRYTVAFAHSSAPELVDKAIALLKEPLQLLDWLVCSGGSVVGTYAGRGAVGFAYIAK